MSVSLNRFCFRRWSRAGAVDRIMAGGHVREHAIRTAGDAASPGPSLIVSESMGTWGWARDQACGSGGLIACRYQLRRRVSHQAVGLVVDRGTVPLVAKVN
jgi:hypothetical protein